MLAHSASIFAFGTEAQAMHGIEFLVKQSTAAATLSWELGEVGFPTVSGR